MTTYYNLEDRSTLSEADEHAMERWLFKDDTELDEFLRLWSGRAAHTHPAYKTMERSIYRRSLERRGIDPDDYERRRRANKWITRMFAFAIIVGGLAYLGYVVNDARGVAQSQAQASWYGPGLYGNVLGCASHPKVPTRFRVGHFGVAHKTLPCGTMVLICYRRCAWARVIDRGPFIAGREFDLTAAVAKYVRFSSGPWRGRPDGVHTIRWSLR